MPLPTITRFMSGLVTRRNPLDTPFSIIGTNTIVAHNDALIDGSNTEVTDLQTLTRRPGFTAWSPNVFLGPYETPKHIKLYRDLNSNFRVMVDSGPRLIQWAPTGITTVFTKSTDAVAVPNQNQTGLLFNQLPVTFSLVTLGNVLYGADGVDAIKWDGTTQSIWGIAPPTTAPTLSASAAVGTTYVVTGQATMSDHTLSGSITIVVGSNSATFNMANIQPPNLTGLFNAIIATFTPNGVHGYFNNNNR